MDNIGQYAKEETLEAMYASVDRMNRHIAAGNMEGVLEEQELQQKLRKRMEALENA